MNKYYSNHSVVTKVYKKMSTNSEMITQMIYGDAFSIIKKERGWFRIKIKEDGYVGFIKKKKLFPISNQLIKSAHYLQIFISIQILKKK